jgi:chloride channel 2
MEYYNPREIPLMLALYFPYKLIAVAVSVTLPLPVGMFTPTFMLGGVLGRLVGEIMRSSKVIGRYSSVEIAVVGAAAFSTGVTRSDNYCCLPLLTKYSHV